MSSIVEPKRLIARAQDLRVYKMAFDVSLQIHRKSREFPKIEQYALADQMRRASKSVCANLVEGFAKQSFSTAEFRRFLFIAIGSAEEMRLWIDYGDALGYIEASTVRIWKDSYGQIAKMLQSLASKL